MDMNILLGISTLRRLGRYQDLRVNTPIIKPLPPCLRARATDNRKRVKTSLPPSSAGPRPAGGAAGADPQEWRRHKAPPRWRRRRRRFCGALAPKAPHSHADSHKHAPTRTYTRIRTCTHAHTHTTISGATSISCVLMSTHVPKDTHVHAHMESQS